MLEGRGRILQIQAANSFLGQGVAARVKFFSVRTIHEGVQAHIDGDGEKSSKPPLHWGTWRLILCREPRSWRLPISLPHGKITPCAGWSTKDTGCSLLSHVSSSKMWQQLSGTPNWEDVSLVCQTPPPNCCHGSTSPALLCRVASPALLLLPASAGISGVHCSLTGPRRRKS